ncbi:MAG TPA: FHA domain-containing protein [Urbifossiella sp.]|nr:FHA domain-containing protein [Urbifossiella sp.]
MNDPLIARFAEACGATAPLDLRVGLADGGVLAEGTVRQPFTLVGRDDACDVTLNDPDVHPRHAWLQVLDGRVFAVDLGSRAGMVWPDGFRGPGWIDPNTEVKVGPFRVTLRNPVSPRPGRFHPHPMQSDPDVTRAHPAVHLEFRNGRRPKDRWAVNRVLTLIGRAEACKLHLSADDVAAYHCGLVLTPVGLWVVDLSGRGVVVNGERMRVAPLQDGAELLVGRFQIVCRAPGDTPSTLRLGTRRAAPGTPSGTPTPPPDDEVPLGGLPVLDPMSGLPSSHILHDAFRLPAPSGPLSAPILLAAGPGAEAVPPARSSGRLGVPVPVPATPQAEHPAVALIGQLAEIHGQLFEQLQQALLMMARLCGEVRAGRSAAVEQELGRIKELNAELGRLQGEVTRLALAQTAAPAAPADETAVHNLFRTPPHRGPRTPDAADAIQDWVQERIGLIHRERQARWDKLAGLFARDQKAGE